MNGSPCRRLHLAAIAILVLDLLAGLQAAPVEAAAVSVAVSIPLAMFGRAVVGVQWKWHSHLVVARCHFQRCKGPMILLGYATGDRKSCLFGEQIQD